MSGKGCRSSCWPATSPNPSPVPEPQSGQARVFWERGSLHVWPPLPQAACSGHSRGNLQEHKELNRARLCHQGDASNPAVHLQLFSLIT